MINLDDRFITDLMPLVKPNGVAVLLAIAKHCDMQKKAFPSNQTICNLTSLSINTVKKTIKDLKAKRLLMAKERLNKHGRNKSNLYYINTDWIGIYIPAKSIDFEEEIGGSKFDSLGGQNLTVGGSNFDSLGGQNLTVGGSNFDPEVLTNRSINQLEVLSSRSISADGDFFQNLISDKNFLTLTSKKLGLGEDLKTIENLAQDFFDFKKSVNELKHQDYADFRKNFRFWLDKQDLEKRKQVHQKSVLVDYTKFNQGESGIVKVRELGVNQELTQLLDYETGKKLFWYFLTRNGQQEFSVTDSNKTILRLLTEYFSQTKDCQLHRQHGVCLFGAKGVGKSDLMTAFKLFTKEMKQREFKIARCEKIVENLGIEKSITSLAKYYSGDWCFEGVGEESTSFNLFGNTVEVMKKIFTERMRSNARTYLTTRLMPSQFREIYGEEVFEWLAGNMNFLIFQKHEDEKQAAA